MPYIPHCSTSGSKKGAADMENKAGFVQELGELLAAHTADRTGVKSLEYSVDPDGFEAVTIVFDNGYARTTNVTGDSCIAIMRRVAKLLW